MSQSLLNCITRTRLGRTLGAGMLLAVAFATAYVLAFLLRFDGQLSDEHRWLLSLSLPVVVMAQLIVATHFHLYQGWSRYVTFHDLEAIAKSVTGGTIVILLIDAMLVPEWSIPRSVVLLNWGASLCLVGALRATPRLWRHLQHYWQSDQGGSPVLIVGANDAGENLLRALRQTPRKQYRVVGFVDDRSWMVGRRIGGVPVVGCLPELPKLVRLYDVEEVLIHSGELPGKQVRELVATAEEHEFHINVLPSYEQLLAGRVAVQPRPVAIDDLLRRDSVVLDDERIRDWLRGRTVLVTGSAGSIGSEICRQLLTLGVGHLVVVDRSETGQFFLERELKRLAPEMKIDVVIADLTDANRLAVVVEEFSPEIIFHAAAYKHVPLMESHPGEALKNIVLATRNLVDLADQYEISALVMISTDKAVNPTSVMGSCKQLAERYVQAKASVSSCRFVTVRFGNVLDSAGSVVPVFREQIACGGPITVTHPDIHRYFMMIPEAAQLVIQAGAMGQGGEIFVLDMGEPIKITDLARDMIRLSGLREGEDIEIVFTGLRPGEKLFEELYGEQEKHRPTKHAKILVADAVTANYLQVLQEVKRLEELVNEPAGIVRTALAEVVPLYDPGPMALSKSA